MTGPGTPAPPRRAIRSVLACARRRLRSGGVVLAACLGGGALLVAAVALIVAFGTAGEVERGLGPVRGDPAGSAAQAARGFPEVLARVDALAEKMSALEDAVSGERAARVGTLEKSLAEARAAAPGGPELGPDAELDRILKATAQVTALPSASPETAKHLRNMARQWEEKRKEIRRQHEDERRRVARETDRRERDMARQTRERRERLHDQARQDITRALGQMQEHARHLERQKDLQGALGVYGDLAGLGFNFAAKTAAEARKQIRSIKARMEEEARKERERREKLKAEGRGDKRDNGPEADAPNAPAGPRKRGVEVF